MSPSPSLHHHRHHHLPSFLEPAGDRDLVDASELEAELEALDLEATEFYSARISESAPNNLATDTDLEVVLAPSASQVGECSAPRGPPAVQRRLRKKTRDTSQPGDFLGWSLSRAVGGLEPARGPSPDGNFLEHPLATQPSLGLAVGDAVRNIRIRGKTHDPLSEERESSGLISVNDVSDLNVASSSFEPRGRRTLTVSPWLAGFSSALHHSHSFGHKKGIVWCWSCGRFSITKVDKLGLVCPRGARPYGLACLKRLRRGKTPRYDVEWPREAGDPDDIPPDVVIISRACAPNINVLPEEINVNPSAVSAVESTGSRTDRG